MASNYEAGRRFEHAARKVLEDDGYFVMRSAGSKTPVDLIAAKTGQTVLVQCKRHGALGPADRADLLRLRAAFGPQTLVVLAYKKGPRAGVSFCHVTCAGKGDAWTPDEVAA